MTSPNVLIIYTDQQRADALGASGNPHIHTPHLDRLAERGTLFSRCFAQNPVCMPSRASFLTGRYPSALGITHMGVPMPPEIPNIATYFSTAGYHTANIGKLHFLPHANRDHTLPHPKYDFDHLEISDEPGPYEDAYRAWVASKDPSQLPHLSLGLPPARSDWNRIMNVEDPIPHPYASPDAARNDFKGALAFSGDDAYSHSAFVGQRTIDYLNSRADNSQPFMAIAGFYSPHAPWIVPQCFLDQYDPQNLPLVSDRGDLPEEQVRSATHGYYAMVTEVDHWCGKIFETLASNGQADNTIIVFTSDHGEWLGDRGRFAKGYPADAPVSNVPLLIHSPSIAPSERKVETIVEALDVLPTLLELCGLTLSSKLQGQSLASLMKGENESREESALTEGTGWRCLRTPTHRYLNQTEGPERLWKVDGDAEKEIDLAHESESSSQALSELRRKMIAKMLRAASPRDRIWPY
ncbi:MAG: sulfatase-like hydrolase/transferase [Verrucomicrobiota bacterium]